MSKKQLLSESEIRRFMKLANLQPLAGNVLKETEDPTMQEVEEPMDPMGGGMDAAPPAGGEEMPDAGGEGGEEGGTEVEMSSETDPDKKVAFEAAVQALADAMGIEVSLEAEGDEGGEEGDEGGEGDEEEMDMGDEGDGEEDEEEQDELQEIELQPLSEDELVETVLNRVTARLVAEAKKKRMSVKEKMKLKEKKKECKKVEEATEAKGGGPLLSKGGNKHDIYKGHADMAYAKGKEGKGGHQMEDLPAKAEHTVTHGGKNLATLGGNKKKV